MFIKDEAVSALIKSMRFANFEEASYWFIVLQENNMSGKYLAKRLAIFAAEDCIEPELIVLANTVYQTYLMEVGNDNMLWQVLYWCCKSKKFWEVEQGLEYELTINKAIRRFTQQGIELTPTWAIDKHTKRYFELQSQGKYNETDIRFSGDDFGRLFMIRMYQKYGRISADIYDEEILREVKEEVAELNKNS